MSVDYFCRVRVRGVKQDPTKKSVCGCVEECEGLRNITY